MTPPVLTTLSLATWLQGPVPPDPAPPPGPAPVVAPSPNPAPAVAAPDPAPPPSPAPVVAPSPNPAPAVAAPNPAPPPRPAPTDAAPGPAAPPGPPAPDAEPVIAAPLAGPDGPPLAPPPPTRPRKFVFAALGGLTFGISPAPSATLSAFLGGRLRRGNWALGYQLSLSFGLADRYLFGAVAHRHHLTALTNVRRRGFASIGGGVAFFYLWPAVAEIETRIGVRLGQRRRALLGGQVRLGLDFIDHERAPLPQFGLFGGFSLL